MLRFKITVHIIILVCLTIWGANAKKRGETRNRKQIERPKDGAFFTDWKANDLATTHFLILAEICGRALDVSNPTTVYVNPFTYRQGQMFKLKDETVGEGTDKDTSYTITDDQSNYLGVNKKGYLEMSNLNATANDSIKWNFKRLRFDNEIQISITINGRVSCLTKSWRSRVKISKCKTNDLHQKWILIPLCNLKTQAVVEIPIV